LSATLSTAASPSATSSTRTTRPSSPTRASRPTPTAATSTPAPISSRSPRYHFLFPPSLFSLQQKKIQDVQTGFYAYLEERGIDSELATFLPEYTNVKENKSYLEWLKNIQTFVNAN